VRAAQDGSEGEVRVLEEMGGGRVAVREEEEGMDNGGVGGGAEWKEDDGAWSGDHRRGTGVPSTGCYGAP